ncbi:type II toxin-antitoxin system VapC family toxin [Longimycelium tulufanense]|uniref:type II toxin-antitoxin system VapC family toxin n=1 Tax=Longimycelium tulufanense TaxID=907463 RepID=UPI001E4C1DFA|nr:type II toxin-antitoxin system VapC family toxin [Longimycelium tulufanense]
MDTDVASLAFKQKLPPNLLRHLVGRTPCLTFVTLAELTKWSTQRSWGSRRKEQLARWLHGMAVLPGTEDVARVWGEISAFAARRGRPRPQNDTWIAACCLVYEVPLATLNLQDFADFVEHEGLAIING